MYSMGFSLKRTKSALLKCRAVAWLFALFPPHKIMNAIILWSLQSRLPLTFTSVTNSSLFVSNNSSRASYLVGFSITHERKLSSMHSRKSPKLLEPFCVVPPAGIRVVIVPHRDHGLGM